MNEEHKLEKLESKLYARNSKNTVEYKKHDLEPHTWETPRQWEDEAPEENNQIMSPRKQKNPFYKLLIGSFIFFCLSLVVAFFLFSQGGNTVSPDNINITVGGPIQIGGGQELALDVGVENKNNVPIQLVDLVMDYPDGTKTSDDSRTDLKRDRVNLGDIASGGFAHKIFKSLLFGEEGSSKDIKASIEYRVPGSNAIFEKSKIFSLTLNSSPVAIVTKGIKEITSGQQAQFDITVTSNSETPLKNIVLKAEYPFGYSFKESDPTPSSGNDTWKLDTLSPKETRTIRVTGSLQGQNDEERYFKFTVGNASASDEKEIGTVLALSSQSISIKKPFIGMVLTLDQLDVLEYAVTDGQTVHGNIDWVNNTVGTISNAEFSVVLSGKPLDESSVVLSNGGFYDSSTNTITWDKKTNNELASLSPGDSGKLGFSFSVHNVSSGDPKIDVAVSVKGQRTSESSVEQEINSSVSKIVKLTSDLHLASQALYFTGPFQNSGAMPPQSEKPTTYTIVWTVTNTTNGVSNAKVSATLPSYVSWNNKISPSSEEITYDSVTGDIVWNVGKVQASAGFSKPKREVAFQVTLKPSVTQVGTSPVLISTQTLTGTDNYAQAEIKDSRSSLTTRLTDDAGFNSNDEQVQP